MTKALANIFRSTQIPAVLCVASKDRESEESLTFSKINDNTSGTSVGIMVNIANAKSPITGESIDLSNTPTIEEASLNRKEAIAAFVCVASCVGCNHDLLVSEELASKLDAQEFHCTNCGEAVTAYYDGDLTADVSADDLAEDEEEDVVDALDDVEEEDEISEDEEGSDEDEASEEEEDEEEPAGDDESEGDDEVVKEPVVEEEEIVEEDASKCKASEDIIEDETPKTAEVVVASFADYKSDLFFATLADTSKYAVFLGENHIGSILKDEASAGVQATFTKQDLLRTAFGKVFWQNSASIGKGDFSSLTDFGFKPSTVTVALHKVVASELEAAEVENEAKIESAIKEAEDAVVATMTVAAAGINKGVLSGTNLFAELSKLLSRHGVQLADEAAARFVEDFSSKYFNSVVTAAADLRKESADYVRGLSKTIETASYKKSAETSPEVITSALNLRKEEPRKPVVDISSSEPVKKNEFRSVFSRYAR